MRTLKALLFMAVCGVLGTGCVVEIAQHTAYEACAAGESCTLGICQTVGFATSTTAGSICTSSCTTQVDCPLGSANALCVANPRGGGAQCYRQCSGTGGFCPTGTECRSISDVSGASFNICVPITAGTPPCGGVGQACCGTTCNSGLSCASGVCTSPPRAYQLCTPVGGACADSTTCMNTNTGGQPQCTRICPSGDASMCPGYVAGAAQQVVECANFTGNPSMFQCVRLCNSGTDADCASVPGTRCRQVQSGTGAMLRICIP